MSIPRLAPTRRQFTLGLAGAALAFPGSRNAMYNPKLAVHTSVWLREAAAHGGRAGDILDEALSGIQRAGYRRVEVVPDFLTAQLRQRALARMEKLDLIPSIVCASGTLHTRGEAESCRAEVLALAHDTAGLAEFIEFTAEPKRDRKPKSDDELRTEADQLNLMARDIGQMGAHLLFSHEEAEMHDDAREWRYVAAHTEPALVSLCVDVDCAARSAANPWQLVEAAGGRLRSLHLRNSRSGVGQETLREGDFNLAGLANLLRQIQYDGFLVVELLYDSHTPRFRTLPEALAMSRWYMQEIFATRPGAPPVDMGPHVRVKR